MSFVFDYQPALERSDAPAATTTDDLLDLIAKHRPAWHADALCREYPEVNFFPARGESTSAAREICGRCLVIAECRAAGASEHFGLWGGLSDRQRKVGRRRG